MPRAPKYYFSSYDIMIEFRVVDISTSFLVMIVGGVAHMLVDYVKPRLVSSDLTFRSPFHFQDIPNGEPRALDRTMKRPYWTFNSLTSHRPHPEIV